MACRLFDANPLSKPMLGYCPIGRLETNFSEICNQNVRLFIHENAYETIVCEMATILSRGDELPFLRCHDGFSVLM